VNRIVLPRLLRVASFRFAALYVVVFAGSALVLGVTVFWKAGSALQEQMTARIETEAAFLREEFQADGLVHLVDVVRARGQGASALDYLLEDQVGAHLAGEMPATADLKPGWTTIEVPQASEDGGRPERVRALVSDLGGGVLLAVGTDLRQIGNLKEAIATAFLWTVGLAAVLGISGGALLSRAFLGRVDAIARTAEAIIGGDLGRRVPMRGTGDDLDRLAGTLNRMLDRIAILMDSPCGKSAPMWPMTCARLCPGSINGWRTPGRMRGRGRITNPRSTLRLARRRGCWKPFPPYCGSPRWKVHRRASSSSTSTSPLWRRPSPTLTVWMRRTRITS
jgi:HAMP domain-containing protein